MNIDKKDFIKKLIPYIIIGIYGVIIDIAFFNFFLNQVLNPLATHFNYNIDAVEVKSFLGIIAALIGGIAGLINNFLMNEYFVYKLEWHPHFGSKRFLKYMIAIIIGSFIIGKVFIFQFVYMLSNYNNGTLSNLVAIAVGTLINYPINYFWTWNGKSRIK